MKQPPPQGYTILADYREKRSQLPEILEKTGFRVEYRALETGDYLVESLLLVERKTRTDFIQSLITGRLFEQCERMKRSGLPCLMVVEGNPAHDNNRVSPEAVRGAMLTIMVTHQIPVYISSDIYGTAAIIKLCAAQVIRNPSQGHTRVRKPKNNLKKQVYLLMGLPGVGYHLAQRLLKHFGSVEKVFKADAEDLLKIDGIGKKKAVTLVNFIRTKPG